MKKHRLIFLLFAYTTFIVIFSPEQVLASPIKYNYWDNGKLKEAKYYNPQGNLAGVKYYRDNGSLEQFMAYDNEGNTIEESYYDIDGKLCKNPVDNWAVKKSNYTDGRLYEIRYYDENGHITERDFFNENGDFIDRQFVGDSRLGDIEDYKPDLAQFSSPFEEIESRTRIGVETDEFYNDKGRLDDRTVTIDE